MVEHVKSFTRGLKDLERLGKGAIYEDTTIESLCQLQTRILILEETSVPRSINTKGVYPYMSHSEIIKTPRNTRKV